MGLHQLESLVKKLKLVSTIHPFIIQPSNELPLTQRLAHLHVYSKTSFSLQTRAVATQRGSGENLDLSTEFLTDWLPFLSQDLCDHCSVAIRRRIESLRLILSVGFTAEGRKSNSCPSTAFMESSKDMVTSRLETGARLLVTRFLRQYVKIGTIVLQEDCGTTIEFGEPNDKCRVKSVLRVHNSSFYFKIAAEADIGLANAYINGYFSFDDQEQGLLDLLLVLIANRELRNANPSKRCILRGWWTPLLVTAGFASAKYFIRHMLRKNSVTQTRRNISQHYDLSNDLFSLFLDETMSYSCGIFKTEDEELKTAQLNKISSLIDKARVNNEHAVLEIGCGWGSLAIELVRRTGCNYTGITLSQEQLKFAERKVKEAGLEDHINFVLCDYRQLPCPQKFDRIISCEMIEHVGHEYLDEFLGCCESLLAEDGLLVLQFTSMPDSRYDEERKRSGFITEYFFHGGCIPSLSKVTAAMSTSSKLCVEHVENIGIHYYPTLLRWRSNFTRNKQKIIGLGFDEKFIRMFDYYFVYCMAGYKSRTLGNYQMVFSRPGNTKALGDHPTFSSKTKVA